MLQEQESPVISHLLLLLTAKMIYYCYILYTLCSTTALISAGERPALSYIIYVNTIKTDLKRKGNLILG